MNQIQLALMLKQILKAGRNVFVTCDPEILDFTTDSKAELLFISQREEVFRIPLTIKELIPAISILNAAFFQDKAISLITWNIKNYFSYVRHHTNSSPEVDCKILDLKVVEGFMGIKALRPQTFSEALSRVKAVFKMPTWSKCQNIYAKVYLPLITEALPCMESQGVYDSEKRQALYSYYEIEGQVNGRLLSSGVYKRFYLPHSMGPQERERFRTNRPDELFVYFDYSHMEVSVLQALSNDDRLGQILELDEDLYKVVFKLIVGSECDSEKKRDMCKRFFLPVIYGMSAKGVSEAINVSEPTAEKIVDRIYNLFPKSLNWIKDCLNNATEECYDYCGRRRIFTDRRHRIRNFLVQAPAALVCLEKLVKLHRGLAEYARLLCHIHDGYIAYVNKFSIKNVSMLAKDILESDSDFIPGIRLKSVCKTGTSLSGLIELK